MKKLIYSLLFLSPLCAFGQNYNPFVSSGIIAPAPLLSAESAGTGTATFSVGNSGSDNLDLVAGSEMKVTIVLSRGEPNNATPTAAISGTFASKFNWVYTAASKTFVGTQNQMIEGGLNGAGSIIVAYKVTANSPVTGPNNGFSAALTVPAYSMVSNAIGDDMVSSYTWTTFKISGTVFNDANGLKDNIINGTGTNAGGLNAFLVDTLGTVAAVTPVAGNGTYSFAGLNPKYYTVRISTNSGSIGSPAPALTLPTNWVFTGEGTTAAGDGNVNGITASPVILADRTGVNFGIEERPFASTLTAAPVLNPGGTLSVTVPPGTFAGSDPTPGTVDSIRITSMPSNATSITIGANIYTSIPVGGITVPAPGGVPSQVIKVDPINNTATPDTLIVGIPYYTIDNAGVLSSAPGLANMRFVVPDLTPNISASPNIMTGTTPFYLTVKVTELYNVATSGLITVFIAKDPRLTFTYNNSLTALGFTTLNNAVWNYDSSHPVYHIFTTNAVIGGSPANATSTFGMLATFTPGNTTGQYTLTSTITSGSGGEVKTSNNNDAESIDYFSN
jgi:hypothetical protein